MNPPNPKVWMIPLLAVCAMGAACSRQSADASSKSMPKRQAHYAAVARGRVDVRGGLLSLSMPVSGTVDSVAVHEGDHVHRGDVLATLDSTPAQTALDMARARLQQALAQQKLLDVQWKSARSRSQRLRAAAAAGAGDGASADDAADDVEKLAAQRQAAAAASDVARSGVDAADYALRRMALHAPQDADVVAVHTQVGASVSGQSGALFVLLPSGKRIIRAELNTTFADAVHVGMDANVSTDDQPDAIAATAKVVSVGNLVGPSTLEDDPQLRSTTRTVQCLLELDNPGSMRVGQRVLVRFSPAGGARAR